MPTVLQFLSDALSDVGAVSPGMTPSANIAELARRKFNDMVRNWSTNRLRLNFIPEAQYALAPGVGVYPIGPGAVPPGFDTTPGAIIKPVFVQAARTIIGAARRYPLNILTRPEWDVLPTKGLTDPDGPTDLFFDYNVPTATINVAPLPFGIQVLLVSQWVPLHKFDAGDMAVNVEEFYLEEYIQPMRMGLAIQLAPGYRFPVTQDMLGLYQSGIAEIERANNDRLSGAFGFSRTLEGPTKGEGRPIAGAPAPPQGQ